MSTGQGVGGLSLPLPTFGTPYILGNFNALTSGETFTFSYGLAGVFILLGVDWAATIEEPVQCWTGLELNSHGYFWWDSQSTGEGLGVRWQWRGALPMRDGDVFGVYFDAAASINVAGVLWGVVGDWQLA